VKFPKTLDEEDMQLAQKEWKLVGCDVQRRAHLGPEGALYLFVLDGDWHDARSTLLAQYVKTFEGPWKRLLPKP
jgi:hypothetical protein